MGYQTLPQIDDDDECDRNTSRDHDSDDGKTRSLSNRPRDHLPSASPVCAPPLPSSASRELFLDEGRDHDDDNTSYDTLSPRGTGFANLVQSIASARSGKTNRSYDMLEEEDFAADARTSPELHSGQKHQHQQHEIPPSDEVFVPLHIPRPRRAPATAASESSTKSSRSSVSRPKRQPSAPILRTASGQLRHPTPDLQTLQGAYIGNIDNLERTAERLSMTSSIDDAIKELHDEQKRLDSRRSSLLESPGIPGQISRHISNASSIVEVNSAARSGGYSPAGFMMSPRGSFTTGTGRGRSASKSSRFGSRPEPELEGRPLDSFVSPSITTSPSLSRSASIPAISPVLSRSDLITEQDENSNTLTRPIFEDIGLPNTNAQNEFLEQERPTTSASKNTFEQSQTMFADFDGTHEAEEPLQKRIVSGNESLASDHTQKRVSSANRMSMARPQSYADPHTGQQMVYYPAPVPMMLNLPQKLSKNPSSMARNKRRSQVMSSIPQAARQSAIWLPDVLENEDDLAPDDPAQMQEYIPQHQRTTMGGRRNTQDMAHLPPQLRASTFFELPGPNQIVELKEQSAVATLDSILDASAHAPVSAFTDHAFAGHLGAEVYGKENNRNSRSSVNLLNAPNKKRTSSFNILLGRRASSSDLLESDKEKRRATTMSGVVEGKIRQPIDEDDVDDEDEGKDRDSLLQGAENEEQAKGDYGLGGEGDVENPEETYHGPPTTLLAELQLRKQQQKHRTRPLTTTFPNGVHSTLLELDAVAQLEQKTRQQKRVNLAWEDPTIQQLHDAMEDDEEDVPLALLYAKKHQEFNRPIGLLERRELEDNEPLSRRRDRLAGRPVGAMRASTMMNLSMPNDPEEEGETLAQRVRRLKGEEQTTTALPTTRPVSGDFASEMMSTFGGDLQDKGKGKENAPGEEEETLGQRKKRLQAEREARAVEVGKTAEALERPALKTRRSMADILQAHPAAGADRAASYQKPVGGLLGLHEKKTQHRASTMMNLNTQDFHGRRAPSGGFQKGMYNDGQGGIIPPPQPSRNSVHNMFNNPNIPQFAQPTLGGFNNGFGFNQSMMMPFTNPYAMNMAYMNGMQGGFGQMNMPMIGMGMNMGFEPLNQGQIDKVEAWRQSVMQ